MTFKKLAISVALLAACNTVPPESSPPPPALPDDMPSDYSVRSDYFGQAVSPVYHYDYFIVLDPEATDTISFHPDYMESSPPVWIETFDVSTAALEDLWNLMVEEDLFRDTWDRSSDTLFGAWTRTMQVTASGGQYTVPSWIQDTTSANPVYRHVDDLVPDTIWDSLWAWRDRYISGDTILSRP